MVGHKKKGITIFLAILCLFSALLTGLILYANNIPKAFAQPLIKDAELDINGFDLSSSYAALLLKGDWEFFYNKWIVTDGLEGASPDGLIHIQSRWGGKTYGGKKLGRAGYASYRLTVHNPTPGDKLVCLWGLSATAYRAYINGQLVASSGTVSKSYKETFMVPQPKINYYTVKEDDQKLEIVIEQTNDNMGGLYTWPTLNTEKHYIDNVVNLLYYPKILFLLALGFFVPTIIIVIVLDKLNIYGYSNRSIITMMVATFLRLLFSYDVFFRITKTFPFIDYWFLHLAVYATSILFYLSIVLILIKHVIFVNYNKNTLVLLFLVNILCMLCYFLVYGYPIMYAFLCVPFFTQLYFLYKVSLATAEKNKFAKSYLILLTFVFIALAAEAAELSGLWPVGIIGAPSIAFLIIVIIVLTIYLHQVKEQVAEAKRTQVLEKEVSDIKNKALKAQIKPHFIFNMLANIQDQYHQKLSSGDDALAKFSKHLRLNIDSEYKDLVSFEEELDNIQNYFDMENIRFDNKLTLIYDIDYLDFKLPILSLQPLIENAVKYAQTEDKIDGYIQIKSYEENGKIIVEINDNGIGFDKSAIEANCTGIRNISKRLEYSLDATVVIDSKQGEGTTIKIVIPKQKD